MSKTSETAPTLPCYRHDWELTKCDSADDHDTYTCRVCNRQYTERCTFDEDYA